MVPFDIGKEFKKLAGTYSITDPLKRIDFDLQQHAAGEPISFGNIWVKPL